MEDVKEMFSSLNLLFSDIAITIAGRLSALFNMQGVTYTWLAHRIPPVTRSDKPCYEDMNVYLCSDCDNEAYLPIFLRSSNNYIIFHMFTCLN